MKRAQILLDENTYQDLRRQAYEKGCSISRLVRDLLAKALEPPSVKRQTGRKRFPFVGAGRSDQGSLSPVSERHDEALAEAFREDRRR